MRYTIYAERYEVGLTKLIFLFFLVRQVDGFVDDVTSVFCWLLFWIYSNLYFDVQSIVSSVALPPPPPTDKATMKMGEEDMKLPLV